MTTNVRVTHLSSSEGRAFVGISEDPPLNDPMKPVRGEHRAALAPGESIIVAIPTGWTLTVAEERKIDLSVRS